MPERVSIPQVEVDEFDYAIAVARIKKSSEPLGPLEIILRDLSTREVKREEFGCPNYLYREDQCLIVSFNKTWRPYLDNTRGYNVGEQRWFIPRGTALLERVAGAMRALDEGQPGGRTFLCAEGALRNIGTANCWLVEWALEGESVILRQRENR
jgi:hypothetical protein